MKLVIFGLSISSSWGNGHATLWRGLCRALHQRNHKILFFEHNTPYYEATRDSTEIPGVTLVLYSQWEQIRERARNELKEADVGIVTSYCPDGILASELVLDSPAVRVFYDLDTPITIDALEAGDPIRYIGPRGLRDFDLVLSYTGGGALDALKEKLGAPIVAPLYGSVDPDTHRPTASEEKYRADLSYLGTYAANRQAALECLFLKPARKRRNRRFLIGGALYPSSFPWEENIAYIPHVSPGKHPAFYCSSRLTLNITRRPMAKLGYCPSGRLFEAAACGTPILSDSWQGLEEFFVPGQEILTASEATDTVEALELSEAELGKISKAARARALEDHSADRRASELEQILQNVTSRTLEVEHVGNYSSGGSGQ